MDRDVLLQPVDSRPKGDIQTTVDTFTFEVALLFFRMRLAATEHLGQGKHSSGRRSLIKSLGAEGPQTVPAMAKARAVSRQHIQVLVNELKRDGLVASIPNPAHKRSSLIALTGKGAEFLERMDELEAGLFEQLADGIPLDGIRQATQIVREFRRRFESDEWLRAVTKRPPSDGKAKPPEAG